MPNVSEKIVNSVIITMAARLSMVLAIPTLTFLFWLYTGWQAEKFDKVQDQVEQTQKTAQQASDQSIRLSERLTTVETKQAEATVSNERFQNATLNRLDRVQDSIVGLSNTVAALTATLQAIVEDKRRRPP
ncbi:hypothetical protein [Mesorhizobium sp. Pch-S]|uniref:hypothetical protein n=1 Tax=Mesorhizobium sp. Pch-S TaxID=2082387 RepID=UPI00101134B1|nr:hypothetical protein [Mesorhizobium sp. Pch-S]